MNMGRVVLFQVGKEIQTLLGESLQGDIALDAVANTEQLFVEIQQATRPAEALVLGVGAEQPVSIAQHVCSHGQDIPVLILSEPDRYAQLAQALQFSPFLGSEVRGWSLEYADALPATLTETVRRTKKRRRYRGTIQDAQRRMKNMGRAPPRLSHYLDRLIDRAPVGILNADASGTVLNLNRSARQVLRTSERDAVGSPVADLFPAYERTRLSEMMARSVAPQKRNRAEIFTIASGNGRANYVEMTAASLIDGAGQLGCTMILQDVTSRVWAERERKQVEEDLRKSESQLRLITDALPVLISYVDMDHRYRFNNKAYEDWFGYSQTELNGRPVLEVIGETAYKGVKPNIDKALSGQAVDFEMRLAYKGRGERYVRGHMIPDFSDDGQIRGVVTVVSDITESKQAEEREKLHLQELAHVSRVVTLGEMSSQLAHELAQPLTAIANFTEASLRMVHTASATDDDVAESLTDIATMTDRAREIISQLRNFIRKNELQRLPENVNDLVRDVLRIERAEARWNELDLELDLDESLPRVMADKTLIEQVILNLIHNAIEAMRSTIPSQRSLEIQTRRLRKQVQVAVSDTGPGIGDGTTNRIFEPFFTTKESGLGMGLAISRSIVDAHGGRLWAVNNKNGGATFQFTLAADS